jgi:succinyl-CoA synthetase beta subunit
MKIYEYQAKGLFAQYGISVPKGVVAVAPTEAVAAARSLGTMPIVLKAQIHSGGRGKAGGVRVITNLDEVETAAAGLLGRTLVTAQTGPKGQPVRALLVEEAVVVRQELYAGITIDRSAGRPLVLASAEGGVEIETLAARAPQKIIREAIDPAFGLRPFQARRLFFSCGLNAGPGAAAALALLNLYRLFIEKDCSAVEINPLVVTRSMEVVALDAKVNIDENGLFRHPDLQALADTTLEDPREVEAGRLGLNYIKLKGNVGCMVNGAGLAMATMDLVKLAGAEPANFLDVGGGATAGMIGEGLRILLSDRDVKVVFINIFGGILRCDTLATGVKEAASRLDVPLPVVIRLEGTNREAGERILASAGLDLIPVRGMGEAAERIKELLSAHEHPGR